MKMLFLDILYFFKDLKFYCFASKKCADCVSVIVHSLYKLAIVINTKVFTYVTLECINFQDCATDNFSKMF